jgi:hypothetical protein
MSNKIVLIAGKSASGKSASFRNLPDPDGVIFLNCESNKDLPFRDKFRKFVVTDPYQVHGAFDNAEKHKNIHTIIIDSMTFMMAMFESTKVLTAANTMKAWGDYAQFWKKLMQEKVALSTKNILMTAHTMDLLNENEGVMDTLVKVKGATMNEGIESYFSTVVSAKKMSLKKLEKFHNDYLNITPEEKAVGFKYVYQTQLTKETVNERIRSSMGMWTQQETFIDNDAQILLDRLHTYYK